MCMASSHCFGVSVILSLSRRHSSPHCLCARCEAHLCAHRRRPPLSRHQNAFVFKPSLSLSLCVSGTTLCEVRMYPCRVGLFTVAVSSSILVVPQHLRRRRPSKSKCILLPKMSLEVKELLSDDELE
ncbi:hypothetical protein AAHE18_02G109500 [Arachis hypogaea]|nr:uncharacterized protein LOC112747335 [Arachis hypogaea]QHO53635.1 uncharacterized protein DS421_2g49660 [Arachis hypogaea]